MSVPSVLLSDHLELLCGRANMTINAAIHNILKPNKAYRRYCFIDRFCLLNGLSEETATLAYLVRDV